ncbi:hypothetical protein A1O3_06162 [Capronia epimyces CBS 606.96]|uniref:Aminoglycoside phosphotransferase domain-containing protein n=1 Tax=Capronia epimyces CBS 606.96 TaxID=1182542 RepID=W9YJC5_9EURO|nr:uncharacterized protein A1O3_06162 [Capronia epimyces CBS 606.96]EXJ82349.1 hypothetical protein A1O3_06162 [Capronia epimyces CBS 606.96]
MSVRDTLLDLDLSPIDCLYRLQRDQNNARRVLYVNVTDISILPEDTRTSNDELVRELSKIQGWDGDWNTVTVSKLDSQVQCFWNNFEAHALPKENILGQYPFFDVLDLRIITRKKLRVKYVNNGSDGFGFELPWIATEINVYHDLAREESTLAPRLLGYVYEGPERRVIGYLLEEISGRPAALVDLEDCKKALRRLHDLGLVHGDPIRHNIVITDSGPKFIDFEDACRKPSDDSKGWNAMREGDLRKLEKGLMDTSNNGQPRD